MKSHHNLAPTNYPSSFFRTEIFLPDSKRNTYFWKKIIGSNIHDIEMWIFHSLWIVFVETSRRFDLSSRSLGHVISFFPEQFPRFLDERSKRREVLTNTIQREWNTYRCRQHKYPAIRSARHTCCCEVKIIYTASGHIETPLIGTRLKVLGSHKHHSSRYTVLTFHDCFDLILGLDFLRDGDLDIIDWRAGRGRRLAAILRDGRTHLGRIGRKGRRRVTLGRLPQTSGHTEWPLLHEPQSQSFQPDQWSTAATTDSGQTLPTTYTWHTRIGQVLRLVDRRCLQTTRHTRRSSLTDWLTYTAILRHIFNSSTLHS